MRRGTWGVRKWGPIAAVFLVAALFLVPAIGTPPGLPPAGGSSNLRPDSTPAAPAIHSSTDTTCNGVTTCSVTLALAATSLLLVAVAAYTTITLTMAVGHASMTLNLEDSVAATASLPGSYVYYVQIPPAATVSIYANASTSSYYVEFAVDLTGYETSGSYILADCGLSASSGTLIGPQATACTAITQTPYSYQFEVAAAKASESTFVADGPCTQIAEAATTSSVVSADDQYYSVAGYDLVVGEATLASSAAWSEVIVGVLPAASASAVVAPTGLTAVATQSYEVGNSPYAAFILYWTAPSAWYIRNYTVEAFGPTSTGGNYHYYSEYLANYTTINLAFNTELFWGSAYQFRVQAWNSTVEGSWGAWVSATALIPPSSLTGAASSTTTVVLTWVQAFPPPVVTNDTVGYKTAIENAFSSLTSVGSVNSTTVTGLSASTTYYFAVWAWAGANESSPSNVVVVTTTSAGGSSAAVFPPVLTVVATSATSVIAAWSAVQNYTAVNYTLEYGTTFGTYGSHVSEGASTFEAAVTGLAVNTTYFFRVETGATAQGVASNVAPVRTLALATAGTKVVMPPVLAASAASATSAIASWSPPTNLTVANYTLEYGTTYGTYGTHASEGTSLEAVVSSLAVNTTYFFVVVPWTGASTTGPSSNVVPVRTLALALAAPPVVVPSALAVAPTSATSLLATWTAPTNVTVANYTLEYGTAYGTYGTHVSEGAALHASVTGLPVNTTYYLELVVWTAAGADSAASSGVASARTLALAPPVVVPSVVSTSPSSVSSVLVTWTAPTNATPTNYTLVASASYPPGLGSAVHASEGTALDATLTGLSPNTTYYVQIVVWTAAGQDAAASSGVASVRTLAVSPPTPPLILPPILTAAGAFDQVLLAWSQPTNTSVANYTLEYGTSYGSYGTHVSEGSALHASVSALSANSTYWFVLLTWTGATSQGPTSNVAVAQTWPVVVRTVYANSTFYVNTTQYRNYWHNTTNWVNTTVNVNHNSTVYINTTLYTNRTINRTLWQNTTVWHNTTVNVNKTVYANSTVYHNSTVYVNLYRYAPVATAAATGIDSITVSWLAPSGPVTNYTLMYARFYGLPIAYVSVGNHTVYNLTNLGIGITYYFTVWAWNGSVRGPPSNVATAQTDVPAPAQTPFPWATLEAITTLSILGSVAGALAMAAFVSRRRGRRAERSSLAVSLARQRAEGGARYPAGRAPPTAAQSYSALRSRRGPR